MLRLTYFLPALLFLNTGNCFTQTSPIRFLNRSCTIRVDTTFRDNYFYSYQLDLRFRFVNTGEHVTFIDSIMLSPCITKPGDTNTINLHYEDFFRSSAVGLGSILKKDTSRTLIIPFYYEGQIYKEKITCFYTLGKSKLIHYDPPHILVTDTIAQFYGEDRNDTITRQYPGNIEFKLYYTVTNITDAPIWCTRDLLGYNDTDIRERHSCRGRSERMDCYEMIPPHSLYKIPVEMLMGSKYMFSKSGAIIVFSEDTIEQHRIKVESKFQPKGKYRY